jgi:hypothetical protein
MDTRGVRLRGDVLKPTGEANSVRVRDGEVLISDEPLAETEAPITGYKILDCADMGEALEVASKHPVAPTRRFIRLFSDLPDMAGRVAEAGGADSPRSVHRTVQ